MSVSLAIGAFAAFIYAVLFILRNYQVNIINQSKVLFSALSISVGYLAVYFSDMGLIEKSLVYLTYFTFLTFIFKINVIKLILKRKWRAILNLH